MPTKLIQLDLLKCNGCKDCEVACSLKRTGLNNPAHSCIRVIMDERIGKFYFPAVCFQCSDSPCVLACPVEAIYRDEDNRVIVQHARCIGCKMCIAACPFGVMSFDHDRGRAFKCDLCGGDPECVRICKLGALSYVEMSEIGRVSALGFAQRFVEASLSRRL